jgi:hypothetical protein
MKAQWILLILSACLAQPVWAAGPWFEAWHNTDEWYEAGDARLDPAEPRRLLGLSGSGVIINGPEGKSLSLITHRRDYRDVLVHLEFMVARGANSGVIFHGNHEIQILDSHGVVKPTAGHCGGVYPPAAAEPTYHHLPGGSPPRFNAARPAGEWQSLDILFRAPRFDANGEKVASARFVRVVHNGIVIQEDVEVPHASGTNWDRLQYPQGPVIIQGDYGPVAIRNVRVNDWDSEDSEAEDLLNRPPEGFTALFNGRDLAGWHTPPAVREFWSIEEGVLKSYGLVDHWRASLTTKKQFRDFILMLDFRMPTISDSGINFRRLIPEIPGFGDREQFNLRSRGGMGHLESYYFLPKETATKMELKEEEKPHVRHIDPEVGVWHTVKLTVQGRTLSAEYDGEVLLNGFRYHDWMLNLEPAPISLQKHKVVHGDNLGEENPCPIEYRNVFIRELEEGSVVPAATSLVPSAQRLPPADSADAVLLARIDRRVLPEGYDPRQHQPYVDRRLASMSDTQLGLLGRLWREKQRIDPDMPNRGASFVRILDYVATQTD